MNLVFNYRLLACFLLLLFIDYEVLSHSLVFISQENPIPIMLIYFLLTLSLSLLQPLINFSLDFYEKYTLCHSSISEETLALIGVIVSSAIVIVETIFFIWITNKFGLIFFSVVSIMHTFVQFSNTIKTYRAIRNLTSTMKCLKKLKEEDLKQYDDVTCMICLQDMAEATKLPCQHFFHEECLRQWIIKNSNHFCPKCKKAIDFTNPEGFQEQKRQHRRQNRNVNVENPNWNFQPKRQEEGGMNWQKDSNKEPSMIPEFMKPSREQTADNILATNESSQTGRIGSFCYGLPAAAIYDRKFNDRKRHMKFSAKNELLMGVFEQERVMQLIHFAK